MTRSTVARANKAMMEGKSLSSYKLPESVKRKIAARRYTQEEINQSYAAFRAAKAG